MYRYPLNRIPCQWVYCGVTINQGLSFILSQQFWIKAPYWRPALCLTLKCCIVNLFFFLGQIKCLLACARKVIRGKRKLYELYVSGAGSRRLTWIERHYRRTIKRVSFYCFSVCWGICWCFWPLYTVSRKSETSKHIVTSCATICPRPSS